MYFFFRFLLGPLECESDIKTTNEDSVTFYLEIFLWTIFFFRDVTDAEKSSKSHLLNPSLNSHLIL